MSTIAASPAAASPVAPLYAGFWRRGAAVFVDSLLLAVPNIVLGYLMPGRPVLSLLLQILIGLAYYALMHSSAAQATFGKQAFGIKVADLQGNRISLGRAIGRYFATWLSGLTLGIGFLLAAFTERKQALHDMVSGTVVVNAKASPAEIAGATAGTMPLTLGVWLVIVLMLLVPGVGMVAAIAIPAYQEYGNRAKGKQVLLVPEKPAKSMGLAG